MGGPWPPSVELSSAQPLVTLASPLHPSPYPSLLALATALVAPAGATIVVEFLTFHLEEEQACLYDSLVITDQVTNSRLEVAERWRVRNAVLTPLDWKLVDI